MFNILSGIKIAIVIAVVGSVYAAYRHVSNLQSQVSILTAENATLESNNAQLTQGIKDQQQTIATLQEDFNLQSNILRKTYNDFQGAQDRVTNLEVRLGEHELGYLASKKPKLVEQIIDRASKNISRCFEIATGSPLTDAERTAKLPSQINQECPELANPAFKDKP